VSRSKRRPKRKRPGDGCWLCQGRPRKIRARDVRKLEPQYETDGTLPVNDDMPEDVGDYWHAFWKEVGRE
jgi:hypothetical protein